MCIRDRFEADPGDEPADEAMPFARVAQRRRDAPAHQPEIPGVDRDRDEMCIRDRNQIPLHGSIGEPFIAEEFGEVAPRIGMGLQGYERDIVHEGPSSGGCIRRSRMRPADEKSSPVRRTIRLPGTAAANGPRRLLPGLLMLR